MLAVYGLYGWIKAEPPPGPPEPRTAAASTDPPPLAASPVTTTVSPSLLQLHAAFREAQRCTEELVIVRANIGNHVGTMPPHIPGCDEMKGAIGRLYEATKAAAKAGDASAQMCYLMQAAGDRDSGFMLSDAERVEYQSLAPQYMDAAFKRGDWRVVNLLAFHVTDWVGMFIELEPWKDPLREYKAHRLLLLGTGGADSQDPDRWQPLLRLPESTLSAEERRESDAWAQDMYERYFSSQPSLLKEPRVCTDENATG